MKENKPGSIPAYSSVLMCVNVCILHDKPGIILITAEGSKVDIKCVCPSFPRGAYFDWFIARSGLMVTTTHPLSFVPEWLLTVNQMCCRRFLGTGSALWHQGLYLKTFTMTLFPSIKNVPDSWDGCHVFCSSLFTQLHFDCPMPSRVSASCQAYQSAAAWFSHYNRVLGRIIRCLCSKSGSITRLIHSVLMIMT